MGSTTVFTRPRSAFWLRVNENDDGSYNFFVSRDVLDVLNYHYPELEEASPKGWQEGKSNTSHLWVPPDRADDVDAQRITKWATLAGNKCVWLKLGKHLQPHFQGDELRYCIAGDFNFLTDASGKIGDRSPLGAAEWQLKYHYAQLSTQEREGYCQLMSETVLQCYDLLPLSSQGTRGKRGSPPTISVTMIPAEASSSILSHALAKHVADNRKVHFVPSVLTVPKPKMKNLGIADKIAGWTSIYGNRTSVQIDAAKITGHDVVVVDDLYQSGVTMWAYARYLKAVGAREVYGLVCVKSMKDTDNK